MSRSTRTARAATFAYVAINGFVMGTWVVHINVTTRQARVGAATLGDLLLVLGGFSARHAAEAYAARQ